MEEPGFNLQLLDSGDKSYLVIGFTSYIKKSFLSRLENICNHTSNSIPSLSIDRVFYICKGMIEGKEYISLGVNPEEDTYLFYFYLEANKRYREELELIATELEGKISKELRRF